MNVQRIIGYCMIAASVLATPAYAAAPVVIEYYGQNNCGDDLDLQKKLYEVVRRRGDVILLNCRTAYSSEVDSGSDEKEKGVHLYFNDFCTKRSNDYNNNSGELIKDILLIMVNGRWVASSFDIMPAVKLGAMDNLTKIGMVRDGEALHITVPRDTLPKDGRGILTLFAYAPSTSLNIGEPLEISIKTKTRGDSINSYLDGYKRLIPLDDDGDNESDGGCGCSSVEEETGEIETAEEAFEKELAVRKKRDEEAKELFFRPVAAMEEIGIWDGSKAQYDVSLATIALKTGIDLEKMGYVVLLQEGDNGSTPVIGAGEIIPLGEQMQRSLPKSEVSGELAN